MVKTVADRRRELRNAGRELAAHDRRDRAIANGVLRGELMGQKLAEAVAFMQGAAKRRAELELFQRLARISLNVALDKGCWDAEARDKTTWRTCEIGERAQRL